MKNSKLRTIFGLGRRWIFTLALFIFVFALASVVKIQAAGNVTGWLWGGTEDASLVPPAQMGVIDGNETGVGWVKMAGDGASWNGSSCTGTNDYGNNNRCNYGVKIPSTDGLVSGYAWANTSDVPNSSASHEENGLGWIQFDPSGGGVSVTTTAGEKRLSGKARIMSIANAGANAGGWLGWIKMSGDGANWNGSSCEGGNNYNNNNQCNYGVKIDSSGNFSGYAWSDELGWINFSRAKYTIVPAINLTPETFSLGGTLQTLRAEIQDATPDGQTINFTKSGANPDKFDFVSGGGTGACTINSSGYCNIDVKANNRSSAYTATITASSTGFTPDSSSGTIIQALACNISCPSSIEVIAGNTKPYDVTVSGPSGCSEIDSCSMASNSFGLSSTKLDGNTCRVTSSDTNRAGSAVSTSYAGSGTCPTTVYIKGPGWVETNPQ